MMYRIILSCTVEQTAELNVEAGSPAEAAALAKQRYETEGVSWEDCDINYGTHEVYGPDDELQHSFTFQTA